MYVCLYLATLQTNQTQNNVGSTDSDIILVWVLFCFCFLYIHIYVYKSVRSNACSSCTYTLSGRAFVVTSELP